MSEILIRPLLETDIDKLRPILRQRIKDPHTWVVADAEVDAVMEYMRGKKDIYLRDRYFSVAQIGAESHSRILGCMAYGEPEPDMNRHFGIPEGTAAEILNAFVTNSEDRPKGVGRALLTHIENRVREAGRKLLVVNSGPRYEKSGWPFWDHVMDSEHGFIQNKYGPGRHAKTWKKTI